jgi:hypothetical protein
MWWRRWPHYVSVLRFFISTGKTLYHVVVCGGYVASWAFDTVLGYWKSHSKKQSAGRYSIKALCTNCCNIKKCLRFVYGVCVCVCVSYDCQNRQKFLSAFVKLRKATVSFVMSVRPFAWNNSIPTGRIFMKFDIWGFLENMLRVFKFYIGQE